MLALRKSYPFIFGNFILPIYDFAKGTSRFRCNRILSKTQWFSREQVEHIQNRNLRALIKNAYENVPYYRRLFKEKNLHVDDIRTKEDLAKLPVLLKSDIRKHFSELISRNYPANQLVYRTSGGTGDQIRFYVTKEQMSWEVAAEYRAYGWGSYNLGDKCLMLWGSPLDVAKQDNLISQIASQLERVCLLNTYVLSDSVLRNYIELMKHFRPRTVRGYSSSVYMMARYILERDIDFEQPEAVFTSAEMLFPFQRLAIEKAFGCPVFDYYGSREVGAIAAECEEHAGYHISAENIVLECVENGQQVACGENGVLLITNLRNHGMPLIRYAIGDVGKLSCKSCNCGRGLPVLESIEGRVSQFMAVYDKHSNRIVPVSTAAPGPFSMALMQIPLDSYRIVQESLDRVVIKAVKGKGYSQKHTDFVVNYMRSVLGEDVKIEFEFLPYLPSLPSGKRSVFISKVNPFQA